MSLKIKNKTQQVIPVIIPGPNGGEEKRILPRQSLILAMDKPTNQMLSLSQKGKLEIRR